MTTILRPTSNDDLVAALRATRDPIRLIGSGSRQHRLPDAGAATRIDLSGFDRIERFDAGDHTCSVGGGVRREVLDEAAAAHGLCLPCPGNGTIGGLFASDPIGAVTVGGPQPRSLLLGMEAVTGDGTEFRSGARVSKSVAGFDLHRLFVGSRGLLGAATLLHLRLKPRPRAAAWFRQDGLLPAAAHELFMRLRCAQVPPAALHLSCAGDTCAVIGRIEGRDSFVSRTMRDHDLMEGPPLEHHHLQPTSGGEILAGTLAPSGCLRLLDAAPSATHFILHGGGRFEMSLPSSDASDDLIARLPALGVHGFLADATPARRGRGTPLDPGQEALSRSVAKALDPHGIFI